MANFQIQVPKVSDTAILEFFGLLQSTLGFASASVSVTGLDGALSLGDPSIKLLNAENGFAICSAGANKQINNGNCSISFSRQVNQGQPLSPDRIDLSNNRGVELPDLLRLQKIIQSTFFSGTAQNAALLTNPAAFAEVISSHQKIVTDLESAIAKIGTEFAEKRLQLETEYQDKARICGAELVAKTTVLEDSYAKMQAALAEREKALDDRDNVHARREIRQELKRRLQDHATNFSLTQSTRRLRFPIHIVIGFALAGLAFLIGYITWKFGENPNLTTTTLTSFLIKSGVLTITAIGILAWYIRWLNRWFEQHADTEFYLKHFELDIDRASWIVESALEWKASQEGEIPEVLLQSVSRNLFAHQSKECDENLHPAEYLAAAIFGQASGAKIQAGGTQFEFNRSALRRAAKAVE